MSGADAALQGLVQELRDLVERHRRPTPSPYSDHSGEVEYVVGDDSPNAVPGSAAHKTIDISRLYAYMHVGHIVNVAMYDPKKNPAVDIFGLPPDIIDWLKYAGRGAGVLPPGRYQYKLSTDVDIAVLEDYRTDSRAPQPTALGNYPNPPRNFQSGDSGKTFYSPILPALAYDTVTFLFDNETDVAGTATVYGGTEDHFLASPTLETGFAITQAGVNAPNASQVAVAVNLQNVTYPYLFAKLSFAVGPQAGFLRIIPVARRG